MSDIDNTKALYCLEIKPKLSAEEKHLAKTRELQRRERKVNLYSYPSSAKNRNSLMW